MKILASLQEQEDNEAGKLERWILNSRRWEQAVSKHTLLLKQTYNRSYNRMTTTSYRRNWHLWG